MPDYLFSYWNGTTEVEVFQEDPAYTWETDWQPQWLCGPTTKCSSVTFVSSVTPGPYLYPGSTIYPGGYN